MVQIFVTQISKKRNKCYANFLICVLCNVDLTIKGDFPFKENSLIRKISFSKNQNFIFQKSDFQKLIFIILALLVPTVHRKKRHKGLEILVEEIQSFTKMMRYTDLVVKVADIDGNFEINH